MGLQTKLEKENTMTTFIVIFSTLVFPVAIGMLFPGTYKDEYENVEYTE